ncbi:hypothetical protein CUMW_122840, partial [Citrus unshiu]
ILALALVNRCHCHDRLTNHLSCLESDEELPFKKRKLCCQWDKEMARDERVYEMMKVKMETTIMYELADAPDEVHAHPNTPHGGGITCPSKYPSRRRDVSTPLAFRKGERRYKKSPHNYVESVGTRTIALIVILNFEGNGPPLGYKPKWPRASLQGCNDSLKMDEIIGEMVLEKTVEMAKWNPRSGREGTQSIS